MKKLARILLLLPTLSFGQLVPKDGMNTPIYGGLGLPFAFQPTINTTSYASAVTLPVVGSGNTQRQFRSVKVLNNSSTRTIYICFGSTACSVDAMVVPPGVYVVNDQLLYGWSTSTTSIWAKLDSAGSVTPIIEIW